MHKHLVCGDLRLEHTVSGLSINFYVFRSNTIWLCYLLCITGLFFQQNYESISCLMKAFTAVPIFRNNEKPAQGDLVSTIRRHFYLAKSGDISTWENIFSSPHKLCCLAFFDKFVTPSKWIHSRFVDNDISDLQMLQCHVLVTLSGNQL